MSLAVLPAHHTKHLSALNYPFSSSSFLLNQNNDGTSNGTALWLGAQCLSLFLPTLHSKSPRRVLELGSGIGLTALALSSLGWDVVATDTQHVIDTVLWANIRNNMSRLPFASGKIQIRELDWTIPPDEWDWNDQRAIASSRSKSSPSTDLLGPPFDLVCTADTIYDSALVEPLLRSIHAVCTCSRSKSSTSRPPPAYICIERRDPALTDRFLAEARSVWHFVVERIPRRKVGKAMQKGGVDWAKEEWEGIEIWKLTLSSSKAIH
ncbi:hypothetical protein JOM56_003610 [Amanita muscaria]